MVRENRLFVGNPGTGKSTLINCLIGENHSRAGLNWGGGLTQDYQRFEHDGIAYMDTPGLADETIAQEAAKAITKALKEGGKYKLFFMVRLQNGRIVSEDITTLQRVLDSIEIEGLDFAYTVVMNCLGKMQYEKLSLRDEEFKKIKTMVNCQYLTDSFCFVPRIEELEERSDHIVALPEEVCDYIANEAPVIQIETRQVKAIDTSNFMEQTLAIKRELEKLRTQQSALLKALREQERRHENAMQKVRMRQAEEDACINGGGFAPICAEPIYYHAISIPAEPATGCCTQRTMVTLCTGFCFVVVAVSLIVWRSGSSY